MRSSEIMNIWTRITMVLLASTEMFENFLKTGFPDAYKNSFDASNTDTAILLVQKDAEEFLRIVKTTWWSAETYSSYFKSYTTWLWGVFTPKPYLQFINMIYLRDFCGEFVFHAAAMLEELTKAVKDPHNSDELAECFIDKYTKYAERSQKALKKIIDHLVRMSNYKPESTWTIKFSTYNSKSKLSDDPLGEFIPLNDFDKLDEVRTKPLSNNQACLNLVKNIQEQVINKKGIDIDHLYHDYCRYIRNELKEMKLERVKANQNRAEQSGPILQKIKELKTSLKFSDEKSAQQIAEDKSKSDQLHKALRDVSILNTQLAEKEKIITAFAIQAEKPKIEIIKLVREKRELTSDKKSLGLKIKDYEEKNTELMLRIKELESSQNPESEEANTNGPKL